MAKIPNASGAVVAGAKVTHYLLDPTHRNGGPKARFLISFGFTAAQPAILVDALVAHVRTYDVDSTETNEFGVKYAIVGPLQSPDARNPSVTTVWHVAKGGVPRFVTLVPRVRA